MEDDFLSEAIRVFAPVSTQTPEIGLYASRCFFFLYYFLRFLFFSFRSFRRLLSIEIDPNGIGDRQWPVLEDGNRKVSQKTTYNPPTHR